MVFYGFLWFSRFSFVYILLFWDRVLVLHSRFGHQTNKKKKKNFKIKKNKKYNNKDIKKKKKKTYKFGRTKSRQFTFINLKKQKKERRVLLY